MVSSEVEKIFRAFAEKRKAELPRFTPDGIPITLENKFDDAIYNYLYKYWKEQSGEYDPKKDVIPESEMNKMHPKTKNEKKFEQWLLQQYGMTKKEQRGYTLEGNLESLWEIFSAADMVLFARGLPSIGKELAQLGKKAVDDVAEEAVEETVKREVVGETVEKTVKTEVTEEVAENTAKKEVADTAEDLSQNTVEKEEALKDSSAIKKGDKIFKETVTSNQGNVYNNTPSDNHSITTKNPIKGEPNSSVDILDKKGNVVRRRWFDSEGNPVRDLDYTNHGNPKTHPEWPHEHIWKNGTSPHRIKN